MDERIAELEETLATMNKHARQLEAENARLMAHIAQGACVRCERDEARANLERLKTEQKRLLHIEVLAGSTLHRIAECCTEQTAKALAQTAMLELWPGWDKGAEGELRTVFQPGEKYETLTVDEVVERNGAELVQRIRAEEREACAKIAEDHLTRKPIGERTGLEVATAIRARGAK